MIDQPINQQVLEWQNSFSIFGISYSGPKDGSINSQFITAILAVERKLQAYGQIFTGSGVKMSVADAKKKYLPSDNVSIPSSAPQENNLDGKQDMKIWESFLSQNLPVVGVLYTGDMAEAGKKLEAAIGKSINKSVAGVIWNDTKKVFNTTPDDIKKALDLIAIQSPQKITELSMDNRITKLASFLFDKSKK